MFKIKVTSKHLKPKLPQWRVQKAFVFGGKMFEPGHIFHAIGFDAMRGYDLEDDHGNKIYETRMMMDKLEAI